jgi:hypothetical protein
MGFERAHAAIPLLKDKILKNTSKIACQAPKPPNTMIPSNIANDQSPNQTARIKIGDSEGPIKLPQLCLWKDDIGP